MYTTKVYVCYYICYKSCLTLSILTTVKPYAELLWKVKKKSLCLQKFLNAIIAVRTLCARRENAVCAPCARRVRAVNTLQQLLARCENVMDAVKTLWERRVNDVGTLWGRCVHAITDKIDILMCIPRRSHSALTWF